MTSSDLITYAKNGNLSKVRDLLQNGANVNAQNSNGDTALKVASCNGHVEVALEILKRDNVDVNVKGSDGDTALIWAGARGLSDVALEILKRDNVDVNTQNIFGDTALIWAIRNGHADVALEIMKGDNVDVNVKNSEGLTALHWARKNRLGEVVRALARHSKVVKVDRTKLLELMCGTSKEDGPVELSLEFIKQCTTLQHHFGSGAFGNVSLVKDSQIKKPFVVKTMKLDHSDQESIAHARITFQTEISALKRFRHPNIIVLYGYNLNVNHTDQFLVYEYAANGSLDRFFKDDGMRARLPADKRLSIMFELARAVHFLHTGGCGGWKLFHRDIKSANICLAEDLTARLIDCGLAKFVPDENSNSAPEPVTVSITNTNGGPAFGTPGYICPEYSGKKYDGMSCPYEAAFDVFSIGVVMVELILGCLTVGKSTRNGMKFESAFRRYGKDANTLMLERDVDPSIIWNPDALQLVCETAMQCITPSSRKRLTTEELLPLLSKAVNVQAGIGYSAPDSARDGRPCEVCNRSLAGIKCSEGHELCASCIETRILDVHPGSGGCHLSCLKDGCSSQPFSTHDLCGRINGEIFVVFTSRQDLQKMWNDCFSRFDELTSGVQAIKQSVDATNESLRRLAKGLDRSLGALSLLAANQFKECPNLVLITLKPDEKNDLSHPKKWIKSLAQREYNVVFICAHSGQAGHDPFVISVPKGWIAKAAPWLKLSLAVVKFIVNAHGLPFPIPDFPIPEPFDWMNEFLESVVEEETKAVLNDCETLLEKGTVTIETSARMQELAGGAFKMIAEKAKKEKRSHLWMPPVMVPVLNENGTPIWVKKEYENHPAYRVSKD